MRGNSNLRKKHVAVAAGAAALLALVVYAGAMRLTGNFHVILPGELYRSAQPTASQLDEYYKHYAIGTIINLRGEQRGSAWYDAEVAEARRLGIEHVDFRMSARKGLTIAQARKLLSILREAQKPLLVHCEGGADRTGLVAALYLAALKGLGEEAAEAQISIRYGHISLPGAAAYAIDRSWEAMEPWLGFMDS